MKRGRNYIGLANSAHDPAIVIVNSDGEVVFAEDCERYLQNKRAWGAAADDFHRSGKLIKAYCEPGVDLVTATTWRHKSVARDRLQAQLLLPLMRRFALLFKGRDMSPEDKWFLDNQLLLNKALRYSTNRFAGSNLAFQNHSRVLYDGPETTSRSYYHHLTHAAAACYTSGFEDAACLIVDGYGEDTSVAYYRYREGRIEAIDTPKTSIMGSLGYFYAAICWACGFDPHAGEEWKVMGLAAYGKFDPELYRLMKKSLVFKDGRLVPGEHGFLNPELREHRRDPSASPLEAADMAFTAQRYFCEIMFALVDDLYARAPSDNLVLGGGCALNSACNGLLVGASKFKNLHVFSSPADNGNALGAAWLAYLDDHPEGGRALASRPRHTPYLGSVISEETLAHFDTYGGFQKDEREGEALSRRVAELLASGHIIGWVQGRAEFGPRALGNRSILADPRQADVKERLNARVKYREAFRPFAPSILDEHGSTYFEDYQDSPYMERALRFREEVRDKVPGVVHVDGTGRLQTVKAEWNRPYHDLIRAFYDLTGVPIVLNTSFNQMGKPIIHSLEDAIAVFLTSGIDVLVVGNRIYEKPEAAVTSPG